MTNLTGVETGYACASDGPVPTWSGVIASSPTPAPPVETAKRAHGEVTEARGLVARSGSVWRDDPTQGGGRGAEGWGADGQCGGEWDQSAGEAGATSGSQSSSQSWPTPISLPSDSDPEQPPPPHKKLASGSQHTEGRGGVDTWR